MNADTDALLSLDAANLTRLRVARDAPNSQQTIEIRLKAGGDELIDP
jgi:hypothetical protein